MKATLWVALIGLSCSACGQGSLGNTAGQFTLNGKVTGTTVPQRGKIFAIWHVLGADLSSDHDYKFGEGSSTAFDYAATFSRRPPADAISGYGVGTASLLLRSSDALISDGRIDNYVPDAV